MQRAAQIGGRPFRGRGGFGRGRGFSGAGAASGRPFTAGHSAFAATEPVPASHSAMDVDSPHGSNEDVESVEGGALESTSHLSDVPFASLAGSVDPRLLRAVPFPLMTKVQAATLKDCLAGRDVLAQAKTGTGKTVAFLLPSIQRLLTGPPPQRGMASVLVLSPTRELAMQIEKEANALLVNLGDVLGAQHCIGGTNMSTEQKRLRSSRCDIIVATPGRLLDHLQNSGLASQLSSLRVLILDEADRMLDMGFRNEIVKITASLPPRATSPRQHLYFSATIDASVRAIADLAPNHAFITTLTESETNTHSHVPQESLIVPWNDTLAVTVALILEEISRNANQAKIMVFFPTARATGLAASVFRSPSLTALVGASRPICEVHSRMSQSARTNSTALFSRSPTAVLLSSDVTARGVDFPGVTLVVQAGLPSGAEQYVHRLGRTARAGAQGRGTLILSTDESFFLRGREITQLPIAPRDVSAVSPGGVTLDAVKMAVVKALREDVDEDSKGKAYQAALGYYKSHLRSLSWSPFQLVANMNAFARYGLHYREDTGEPPEIEAKTVGMMGLRGVEGLNVVRERERGGSGNGVGRGGGGGRGRGGGGVGHNGVQRGGGGGGGSGNTRGGGGGVKRPHSVDQLGPSNGANSGSAPGSASAGQRGRGRPATGGSGYQPGARGGGAEGGGPRGGLGGGGRGGGRGAGGRGVPGASY